MPSLASGALQGIGALLGVPWLLAAAASAPMPAAPTPPPTYSELRPQLLEAFGSCNTPADLLACDGASQRLEALIAVAEEAAVRERWPRCLGSLTQLQTHLSVFRWGLEPRPRLQGQIDQVLRDCPAAIRP